MKDVRRLTLARRENTACRFFCHWHRANHQFCAATPKNVFRSEKPAAATCNTATQAPRAGNMVLAVHGTILDWMVCWFPNEMSEA